MQPALHDPGELWKASRVRQPQVIHLFRIRPLSPDEKSVAAVVRKQSDSEQLLFTETACGAIVWATYHWLFVVRREPPMQEQIRTVTPTGKRIELDVDEGKRWAGKIVVEDEDENVVERLALLLKPIIILQATGSKK
jgi:hypothetical protein